MKAITRKDFLRQSGFAFAALHGAGALLTAPVTPKLLSFSTLACPDWSFEKILDFAVANGYSALEMRGLMRQIDLTKAPAFSVAQQPATLAAMKQRKLRFINLGSSCNLHFADPVKRKENLDGGKQFIDLAQQLNCPYVRVYPNIFPKEQDRETTLQMIYTGLQELGDYAKSRNVMVVMETHGELVKSEDLEYVMQQANHPQTGLIWDIANMWTVTKEPPATVYKRLKPWIKHTHIKDAKLVDDKPQYVFLGKGEVPIFEAMELLRKDKYAGYFSFEWEKLWHPELADPELALADFPVAMKRLK